MSLFLNGKALACVASTKYLGVIVVQHLTCIWKLHVGYTCILKWIRCKLHAMKPLPDYLLSKLYQAFTLPIFDYCDAVWAATSSAISKPLKRLHSRFLRGISVSSSFVRLTLMERRRFHIAVQVLKVIHKLCPAYPRDWFVYTEVYMGWSGRKKNRLHIPQIHTTVGKKGFFYCGIVTCQNFVTFYMYF